MLIGAILANKNPHKNAGKVELILFIVLRREQQEHLKWLHHTDLTITMSGVA